MIRKNIHFSVDDTFGCFQWLYHNQNSVKDIFDSSTFCYARYLYENYGVRTTFYCIYTDGKASLSDIDSRWSNKFQECGDWMKFGFHCYDMNSDYSTATINEIERDYIKVYEALARITGGGKCFTDTLRLHLFSGNEAVVGFLKKHGIEKLLCADDDRKSYDLTEETVIELKEKGNYRNKNTGMEYIRTNFRVENMNCIKAEMLKDIISMDSDIVIFTHERYLKDQEIRNNLESVFRYIM